MPLIFPFLVNPLCNDSFLKFPRFTSEAFKVTFWLVLFFIEPTLSGNEDHDILFCRELLVTQPYVHKVRSIERAKAWEQIASNLNSIQAPKFRVTTRSLRDRYTHLTTRKAEQLRDEDRASGTEVTPTELDMLLEEILEKENTAKAEIESEDTKKRKAEQDKASADSIRRLAMERMSQTNTREGEVGETN